MLSEVADRASRAWRPVVARVAFIGVCVAVGITGGRQSSGYVLPVMVGGGFVALAVVAPRLCLLATVALVPFSFRFFLLNRAELEMPTEPLVAALVGAYVLDRVAATATGRRHDRNPFGLPLLFFAAVTLASATQAAAPFESAKGAVRAAAFVLLPFPAYLALRDVRTFRRVVSVASVSGVAAALIMSVLLIPHVGRLAHSSAYAGALFGNYMTYGAYLTVFILPLLSLLLFDVDPGRRPTRLALLCVFGGSLLLCHSRGAWVSLAAGIGFLLMLRSEMGSRRKWALVGVGVAAGAVVLLLPGVRPAIVARAVTMFDPEFASNKTRLLRWAFALLMFAQHPVLGAGHGMFARTYVNEAFVGEIGRFQMGAHNEYVQILAELGAVGMLGWMWLLVAFYVYGFRLLGRVTQPYWHAMVAGIMAVQTACNVHNLVGNFMAGGTWTVPFWLAYAALAAIGYIAGRSEGGEPEPAAAEAWRLHDDRDVDRRA